MNKYTPAVFREKFGCHVISKRTLQKFLQNNWEELENRGLIQVTNKRGLRKQYYIIRPILLKNLIKETYVPDKMWIINPED